MTWQELCHQGHGLLATLAVLTRATPLKGTAGPPPVFHGQKHTHGLVPGCEAQAGRVPAPQSWPLASTSLRGSPPALGTVACPAVLAVTAPQDRQCSMGTGARPCNQSLGDRVVPPLLLWGLRHAVQLSVPQFPHGGTRRTVGPRSYAEDLRSWGERQAGPQHKLSKW